MRTVFFLTTFITGMIVSEHFLPDPNFEKLAEIIYWIVLSILGFNLQNWLIARGSG